MEIVCKKCGAKKSEVKFPKDGLQCSKCANKQSSHYKFSVPEKYQEEVKKYLGILKEAEKIGVDASAIRYQWLKTQDGSSFIKNPLYKDPDAFNLSYEQFKNYYQLWIESKHI